MEKSAMQSPKFRQRLVTTRNVVLIGPPGAGKGTQAKRLAAAMNLVHISTGQMLRDAIQIDCSLGMKVRSNIESGQLVSDHVVIGLVAERMRKPDVRHGCIFDGFPRTPHQAEILDELLESSGTQLDCCIHLMIDPNTAVERIEKRASIEFRPDDNPAAILKRIADYERDIYPLINYYCDKNLIVEVYASGPVEEVAEKVMHIVNRSCIGIND